MDTLSLDLNTKLTYQDIIAKFVDLGYQRVTMVLEPGDFAVRGAIIDIFPTNQSHPLRVEYFGDDIDRINSFDCHSQRSISALMKTDIAPCSPDREKQIIYDGAIANESLLTDIEEGDYIVHEDYGVGIYKGMVRLNRQGHEGEFLHIKYAAEDKVYVPLDQLQLIHRYADNELTPKVNRLYDGSWTRTTKKIQREMLQLAHEIYDLYKERAEKKGFACTEDTVSQCELEQSFPHKETSDQVKVINEVKQDMESNKPMDRLICGDVGYGKTEVIIRAAFKALENGKQVAILVPTTLLAEQHFGQFKKRLEPFPYFVEVLSRFRSKKEQLEIIKKINVQQVDLVVGTHRLLQKDVVFKDLGLLIIDEEQRFGVTHKEKLKTLKKNIDVINVTATPIPRTLYMSLTGARDLSRIMTPPRLKKPVMTAVLEFDDKQIRSVIQQELDRNGQVYYLYNKVEKIDAMYSTLKKWFPDKSIGLGHGQQKSSQLQDVMYKFWKGEIDILCCSTIIENGLDVPRANTIILDLVDRLGLSQIHQLRGRVGRADTQGYAYLTYRSEKQLTDKAKKRLQAVKEYATLGAGYKLAMKDLEIRGAGTLLGHKQSGHMTAVGFDLYCSLLEKSVRAIRGELEPKKARLTFKNTSKIYIPDTYIENERERLSVYQRFMAFEYAYQVDDLVDELEDRYGEMPKMVTILLDAVKGQLKG